jgi:hypothetical protein
LDEIFKNTQGQKPEQQIKPRVYIHFTVEEQKERAESFRNLLKQKDFNAPKIEFVGNVKIINTQIRYFRQEDVNLANEVANILQNEGIENVRAQYIGGYEKRAKHLEIWFASDAFSDTSKQMAK